jgi:hypothetical protein
LIFFIFCPSKICVSLTVVLLHFSSPVLSLLRSMSSRHHIVSHFSLSQDELAASDSSFDNVLSYCLPFQVETEVLSSHYRRRITSLNRLTHTLYYYKKIISILVTHLTTQPRLHFASFLARAPRHQSFVCYSRSLSPLSHAHYSLA